MSMSQAEIRAYNQFVDTTISYMCEGHELSVREQVVLTGWCLLSKPERRDLLMLLEVLARDRPDRPEQAGAPASAAVPVT